MQVDEVHRRCNPIRDQELRRLLDAGNFARIPEMQCIRDAKAMPNGCVDCRCRDVNPKGT